MEDLVWRRLWAKEPPVSFGSCLQSDIGDVEVLPGLHNFTCVYSAFWILKYFFCVHLFSVITTAAEFNSWLIVPL